MDVLGQDNLVITHATSTYPCDPDELNLRMIETLRAEFPCPIGYSGHEVGLIPSVVAVALGACLVERHITLDRAMWGCDQALRLSRGFRTPGQVYPRHRSNRWATGSKRSTTASCLR